MGSDAGTVATFILNLDLDLDLISRVLGLGGKLLDCNHINGD
jgi:hypothetical protein